MLRTIDDVLEYTATLNSYVAPTEHLKSLQPSVYWISRFCQLENISKSVQSIVIQGCVGRKSFNLSNIPSLISLEIGCTAFNNCQSIVFDSMNDWMNDEWDLTQLKSITLEFMALFGDKDTRESNGLIMRSMNDDDNWLIRSSISISVQRR